MKIFECIKLIFVAFLFYLFLFNIAVSSACFIKPTKKVCTCLNEERYIQNVNRKQQSSLLTENFDLKVYKLCSKILVNEIFDEILSSYYQNNFLNNHFMSKIKYSIRMDRNKALRCIEGIDTFKKENIFYDIDRCIEKKYIESGYGNLKTNKINNKDLITESNHTYIEKVFKNCNISR